MTAPTEVWVRCDCSGSCGDDLRLTLNPHGDWELNAIYCGGCGRQFTDADERRLGRAAAAEAERISREGSDA